MSSAFLKGMEEKPPNATIILDHFQISKGVHQAEDSIPKAELRFDTLQAAIKLLTGKHYFSLSKPYCATHSC